MRWLKPQWMESERVVPDKRGRVGGRVKADRRGVGRWRLGNEAQGGGRDNFKSRIERAKCLTCYFGIAVLSKGCDETVGRGKDDKIGKKFKMCRI